MAHKLNANTFDSAALFNFIRKNSDGAKGVIEVVVDYCAKANVDITTAAAAIKRNPEFKLLIEEDAKSLNMLVK